MTWKRNKEERIIPLLVQSVCVAIYCAKFSKGQLFNLTGSPKIPVLGEAFTWTCEAFVPPGGASSSVFFYRNNDFLGLVSISVIDSECNVYHGIESVYIFECEFKSTFKLIIPAENMTEYEQNSIWRCIHTDNELYRSPDVILNIESLGPPHVSPDFMRYYFVLEKTNLSVNCGAADRNATSVVSWKKSGDNFFKQNGTTLELLHTLRNSSGTYYCIAENIYSNGDKERVLQFNDVDVLYEPSVSSLDNQTILEGEDLTVTCEVTAGYPRSSFVFWTKTDDPNFRFNRTILKISRIQRNSSGTYRCTAENYYNNLGKGLSSQTMFVNVIYPPTVYAFDHKIIIEGENLSINCTVVPGNASYFIIYWIKQDNPLFIQNEAMLQLPNVQRNSSGIYICRAEFYFDSHISVANYSMVVDVLYPPSVSILQKQTVIEGEDLSVTCNVSTGYPRSFTVYWTKTDDSSYRLNKATLVLLRIQRSSTGTYRCTAENYHENVWKGTSNKTMVINVLYPPSVHAPDQQKIIEGSDLSVNCTVMAGNPISFIVYWIKLDNPLYKQDGAILQIPSIQKNSSGIYICRAENYYNDSYMGVANQSMHVDVLYPPVIEETLRFFANESQKVALSIAISSNPLSNVSWYSGEELLKVETSVETATLTIEKALCTDTRNFTLIASNGVHKNATSTVELIVNCKANGHRNITLGIGDKIGIEFSTTIIAYPEPQFEMKYMNGTANTNMAGFIFRNAINNFTISYTQKTVLESDFGIYILEIINSFGISRMFIDVIPRRKPNKPTNIEASCLVTEAMVRWTSSFDGGSKQTFTVTSLNDGFESGWSNPIPDRGSNIIHETYIGYRQPATFYEFYVSAENMHGITKSNRTSCTTMAVLYLPEAPSTEALSYEAKIAIGSFGGALVFTTIVVLAIVIVRRYKCSCMIEFRRRNREGKEESTQEENENHYEELTEIPRRHTYQSLDRYNGKHVYENPQRLRE